MDLALMDFESCDNNGLSLLESLSFDALLNILVWLEPEELVKFGYLSRDCYALSCSDYLWRRFYPSYINKFINAFQISPTPLPKVNAKINYLTESKKVDSLAKFVGLWSEQWCDVDVYNSTKISYDGNNITVAYTKNKFSSEFLDFTGSVLRFKLSGGDSGWSFIYSLKIADQGKLSLNVFRIHDSMSFNGVFKLKSESEYPVVLSPTTAAIASVDSENTMMIDVSENATTASDNNDNDMPTIDGSIESFQPTLSHRQVAF